MEEGEVAPDGALLNDALLNGAGGNVLIVLLWSIAVSTYKSSCYGVCYSRLSLIDLAKKAFSKHPCLLAAYA